MANKFVLDSSAWLEYFFGTVKGKRVRTYLAKADAFTPITGVIITEICKRYLRDGASTELALTALRSLTKLEPFGYELAEEAARIVLKQRKSRPKFSTADAHIVALARKHSARIITCDTGFFGIPEAIVIQ